MDGDVDLVWEPDPLLGAPFEAAALGPATLVRRVASAAELAGARGVVLHVHGYNDYYFQRHVAQRFAAAGCLFYAVDLRAAGRSLRPGQVPHLVADLREQASDVAAAAAVVRAAHPGLALVVHAHSTGGLTTALWAHAHRHGTGVGAGPDALVLNSPLLALPGSWVTRRLVLPLVAALAPLRPSTVVRRRPSWYATALLASGGGEWDFDVALKRPEGVPLRAGWLRAVLRAQARVLRGLAIRCPVLVAAAASSSADGEDNPLGAVTDTVLDADEVVARAPRLGRDVTVLRVDGGVHDLALSAWPTRDDYLNAVLAWLEEALRPTAPARPGSPSARRPGR